MQKLNTETRTKAKASFEKKLRHFKIYYSMLLLLTQDEQFGFSNWNVLMFSQTHIKLILPTMRKQNIIMYKDSCHAKSREFLK